MQNENTIRQAELYYQFRLRLPKEKEEEIKSAAQFEGKSINEYISACITEHETRKALEAPENLSARQLIDAAVNILNETKNKLK